MGNTLLEVAFLRRFPPRTCSLMGALPQQPPGGPPPGLHASRRAAWSAIFLGSKQRRLLAAARLPGECHGAERLPHPPYKPRP
jgi:hypothetical protein